MSKYFLPLWLPISIVINSVFLVLLQFMPLNATQIPGERRVTLVAIDENKDGFVVTPLKQPVVDLKTKPLPPPPPVTEPPVKNPEKVGKELQAKGVINPRKVPKPTGYFGASDPAKPRKGPSGPGIHPIHAAAPATLHGGNSLKVPPGKPNGFGAHNDGAENTVPGGGTGGGETYGAQLTSFGATTYKENDDNEGIHGTLVVLVTIDATGKVIGANVPRSSGSPDIDRAVERAARKSHGKPAMKNGQTVTSQESMTYHYANCRVWSD